MEAVVNKIIPFSAVDGPGNRTAIFLQGCNFNCQYCHNPETIGKKNPYTKLMTPEEVMAEVKKNIPFVRGITVSGGECTLQADFLKELFTLAKEKGLTTLADSNGSYAFDKDPELLSVMDGAMIDIKAFFLEDHKRITGQGNEVVLRQSRFLAEQGKLFEIRTVISPELFDAKETVNQICRFFEEYNKKKSIRYKLIAFRPMGVRKAYVKGLTVPEEALMNELKSIARSYGFTDIIII
ncbi:radical SAM protein [Acetivibrio ethanolgignens]|uniref:Radical SAM core domain-containing protein n=1 Tax=Acetivibrio ethanolgignens TaxID=290052 RepID=A0A0V8QB84_9FIRM|nr:radical SAM protein [Acetivibrio ethanolgignens]KSV57824.1 hypothetical protein ASU35_03680 [Acetivibrio ethanolgignens]